MYNVPSARAFPETAGEIVPMPKVAIVLPDASLTLMLLTTGVRPPED